MKSKQTQDETAQAIKSLTVFLVKKISRYVQEKRIPRDYDSLKAMKERLEKEEANRQQALRMHEAVKHLLYKKKQREEWERQDRIRTIKRTLHIPYKTWIEQNQTEQEITAWSN